jgi:hypothetical protein
MKPCTVCGAPVPPGSRFCPKCGTAVVTLADSASEPAKAAAPVPPPAAARRPVESRSSAPWWVVPVVIVGLIVIAWVVMANMPDRGEGRVTLSEVETVEPSATPAETGTLVEMNGDDTTTRTALQPPMIIEEVTPQTTTYIDSAPPPPYAAPPTVIPPVPQPQPMPTPSPVITPAPPAAQPRPAPVSPPPATQPRPAPVAPPVAAPEPPPASRATDERISEGEAVSRVRQYIASRRVYDTSTACTSVRSRGLVNEGYTIEVWDSCGAGGGSRRLGRWRVDVKTGEIFRQRDDGRYLAP